MTPGRGTARRGSGYRTVTRSGLVRVVSLAGSGRAAFQRRVRPDAMPKDRAQGWLRAKINLLGAGSVTSRHHLPG